MDIPSIRGPEICSAADGIARPTDVIARSIDDINTNYAWSSSHRRPTTFASPASEAVVKAAKPYLLAYVFSGRAGGLSNPWPGDNPRWLSEIMEKAWRLAVKSFDGEGTLLTGYENLKNAPISPNEARRVSIYTCEGALLIHSDIRCLRNTKGSSCVYDKKHCCYPFPVYAMQD